MDKKPIPWITLFPDSKEDEQSDPTWLQLAKNAIIAKAVKNGLNGLNDKHPGIKIKKIKLNLG